MRSTEPTSSPASGEGYSDELHALEPVPEHARTSTASYQFWIWCGANTAPINWVLGALGIALGLGLWDTILTLIAGNIIGTLVFGVFALIGRRTGVTHMVLSRSAFGRRGAYLPAGIQGLISAGWCAINTWIVLDLTLALLGQIGVHGGTGLKITIVLIIMAIQTWIAANGFRWIAKFERFTVPITVGVLAIMTVVAWTQLGVDWSFAGQGLQGAARWSAVSTVMTAIGIGWAITWYAYAADYSRFVPRAMSDRKLYAATVLGQFLPVVWLGMFGATLATISTKTDPGALVVDAFGPLAIPVLLVVLHGPIATNIINIYSCTLCAQTVDWKINRRPMAFIVGAVSAAFTIFLVFQSDFAHALDGWLVGLVAWSAPWAGIMLVHFFVFARGQVDVAALYDPPGRSRIGDFRWVALVAFVLAMVATWCFQYGIPTWLQGPGAKALGGVDLSWLAGSLVAAGSYYLLGRGRERRTAAVIRTESAPETV
jgi:NCS1 nucleoside transporter family